MKNIFSLLLILLLSTSFAQETQTETVQNTTPKKTYKRKTKKIVDAFEKRLDLNHQFDYIYNKSNSYNQYKVITKTLFTTLRNSVTDSIQTQKNIIAEKISDINVNEKRISSLQEELTNTQNKLNKALSLKESRSVLGTPVSKSIFSTIITITYLTLIILLGLFIYKYNQNLGGTKKAIKDLKNLEVEFDDHKKTSLKRFQEVNRKLQDELNKNWKKDK